MIKKPNYSDKELLFGLIFMLGNGLQTVCDTKLEEISTKQWLAFEMITMYGEEYPTINEVSEAIGTSRQNATQLLRKLEQKGFVKLYPDAADRRKTRIRLTSRAKDIQHRCNQRQKEIMRSLFCGIDAEALQVTAQVLSQMEGNILEMKGESEYEERK